jgi:hypothetical protein
VHFSELTSEGRSLEFSNFKGVIHELQQPNFTKVDEEKGTATCDFHSEPIAKFVADYFDGCDKMGGKWTTRVEVMNRTDFLAECEETVQLQRNEKSKKAEATEEADNDGSVVEGEVNGSDLVETSMEQDEAERAKSRSRSSSVSQERED